MSLDTYSVLFLTLSIIAIGVWTWLEEQRMSLAKWRVFNAEILTDVWVNEFIILGLEVPYDDFCRNEYYRHYDHYPNTRSEQRT